jgi:metal-sulfur cluster biosynthetic enzyme/nitrite reductase/ring-hydroxylating ferredoxin subunit
MSEFVPVANTSEIADPGRLLLEVEDRIVVLLKVGGEYFCLDDVCTHDGGPLSDGRLDDHTIACPRHGAKFDIRTGKALTMPATVDTAAHEVKVEGDRILVRLCEPGELAGRRASLSAVTLPGSAAPASGVVEEALNPMPVQSPATTEIAGDQNAASGGPAGAITEDHVREELKKVIDPELFVNIVDLGLIYNVDLLPAAEGKVTCKIDMTMTSPMCPAGPQMIQNSKQVLGQLPGMGDVEVKIVLDPPWTPDKMTQEARDQLGIF